MQLGFESPVPGCKSISSGALQKTSCKTVLLLKYSGIGIARGRAGLWVWGPLAAGRALKVAGSITGYRAAQKGCCYLDSQD